MRNGKEVTGSQKNLSIVLMSLILLGAGCAKVGPDFAPPPVTVSQKWLASADQRVTASTEEYRAWWRVFNDAALDRLIEAAYRENLSLRLAGVRVLEARLSLTAPTSSA